MKIKAWEDFLFGLEYFRNVVGKDGPWPIYTYTSGYMNTAPRATKFLSAAVKYRISSLLSISDWSLTKSVFVEVLKCRRHHIMQEVDLQ
jgi:hypothetical protein